MFHISEFASEHQEVSANVIRKAYLSTEEAFLSLVREQWRSKPQIASVGTCCLAGIICNGHLYVANAGDSRVVLGRAERAVRGVTAVQLSTEHNANMQSVRDELRSMHPDDSQIVVLKHKVWRVKGIIQVIFFTFLFNIYGIIIKTKALYIYGINYQSFVFRFQDPLETPISRSQNSTASLYQPSLDYLCLLKSQFLVQSHQY